MTEDQKRRIAIDEGFRQAYEVAGSDVEEFLSVLADWLLGNRLLLRCGLDWIVIQALRERAREGE